MSAQQKAKQLQQQFVADGCGLGSLHKKIEKGRQDSTEASASTPVFREVREQNRK